MGRERAGFSATRYETRGAFFRFFRTGDLASSALLPLSCQRQVARYLPIGWERKRTKGCVPKLDVFAFPMRFPFLLRRSTTPAALPMR